MNQRGLSLQLFDDSGQLPAKAGEVLAEGGKWMLKTWRAFGGSCH